MKHPQRVRVKCLPLDSWMLWDFALEDCLPHYEVAEVIFNKPGIYMVRGRRKNSSWFELPDGRAFHYRVEDFEYELGLLDAERLNARQVEALQAIVAQGLATKSQKTLLHFHEQNVELKSTHLDGLRSRLRFQAFEKRIEK